jgi:hypothetical protein
MMLRKLLFVLLVGLVATAATAMPVEIWEETYATDGVQAKGMDVAVYDNEDAIHALVIAGIEEWTPSLRLDKVDGEGNVIWQTTIAQADSGLIMNTRVLPLADGGAVITYSLNWKPEWFDMVGVENHGLGIVRLDANGQILWSDTTYHSSRIEKQVRDIALINNNIVFSGWWGAGSQANGGRTAHITTYGLEGSIVSRVLVDETLEISRLADADIAADAVYMCGSIVTGGEFISKVGYDGQILWTLPTEMELATEMTLGFDDHLYVTGMNSNQNYMVASVNSNGTYNWQRIFEEGIPNPPSQAIVQLPDGRIAVWKNNLQLVLIDPDGQRIFEGGVFGEPDNWKSNAISLYPNGDLILSSSGMGTGAMLTRVGEAITDVNDTPAAARVTEFTLSAAHPNPFNSMTTLTVSVAEPGEIAVSIIDVLGRTRDEWSLSAPFSGRYELSWTANDFASGLYFVRVVAPNGASAMQKLVLVR